MSGQRTSSVADKPCRKRFKDMRLKLKSPGRATAGFNLLKLMFGIGIGALVPAGVATAFVGDFLPWMALMSAAILGIPLGGYLVGKSAAIADSKCRLNVTEGSDPRSVADSTRPGARAFAIDDLEIPSVEIATR